MYTKRNGLWIECFSNFSKSIENYTYLNAEENPRCLVTRSRTKTSFPCSCRRNVFASTSRSIRLKCSLSTRNRWQLFSFNTMVAALLSLAHFREILCSFLFVSFRCLMFEEWRCCYNHVKMCFFFVSIRVEVREKREMIQINEWVGMI